MISPADQDFPVVVAVVRLPKPGCLSQRMISPAYQDFPVVVAVVRLQLARFNHQLFTFTMQCDPELRISRWFLQIHDIDRSNSAHAL